jgi:hypothetical protein
MMRLDDAPPAQEDFTMTRIILDSNTANQLSSAGQPAELCDPTGKVVGRFVPLIDRSKWVPDGPEPTEEELDEIENSDEPTYTTAEVIAHLEKLP